MENKKYATIYPHLTEDQKMQLNKIEPVVDCANFTYFPCAITLLNGLKLDCVYIVEANEYIENWGKWPENDPHKLSVSIKDVDKISESPFRLPIEFAKKIYKVGESGMGYIVFAIDFNDGNSQTYTMGGMVDFLLLPECQAVKNIKDIRIHVGRDDYRRMPGLPYYWCLYSK